MLARETNPWFDRKEARTGCAKPRDHGIPSRFLPSIAATTSNTRNTVSQCAAPGGRQLGSFRAPPRSKGSPPAHAAEHTAVDERVLYCDLLATLLERHLALSEQTEADRKPRISPLKVEVTEASGAKARLLNLVVRAFIGEDDLDLARQLRQAEEQRRRAIQALPALKTLAGPASSKAITPTKLQRSATVIRKGITPGPPVLRRSWLRLFVATSRLTDQTSQSAAQSTRLLRLPRTAPSAHPSLRVRSSMAGGVPGGIRTHDPRIRNPVLYPAELRGPARAIARQPPPRTGPTAASPGWPTLAHAPPLTKGLLIRSSPKVPPGPCPQRNRISSPKGNSFSRIEVTRAS